MHNILLFGILSFFQSLFVWLYLDICFRAHYIGIVPILFANSFFEILLLKSIDEYPICSMFAYINMHITMAFMIMLFCKYIYIDMFRYRGVFNGMRGTNPRFKYYKIVNLFKY